MSTVFPKWTNRLPAMLGVGALGGLSSVVGIVWYYFTPKFWEVGYMPVQPGSGFPHDVHVGKLGMDCRYCHTNIERSAEANIPDVATCVNCHAADRLNAGLNEVVGPKVQFVLDAYAADESVRWRRVHKLPDYVRNFPHNIHIQAGVSCYSCHGMIAAMPVVHQVEPLSMGWCLDCHRDPTPYLVPPEKVTDLFWVADRLEDTATQRVEGARLLEELKQKPLHLAPENCGACHY